MPFEGNNLTDVRRRNRSAALRILHEYGSVSRKFLAESTKLTPAAISKITSELISEKIVLEGSAVPNPGVGRREIKLELNQHARCALGILINLQIAVISAVWLDGSVLCKEIVKIPEYAAGDDLVNQLSCCLQKMVIQNKVPKDAIIGLGIAIRGITDQQKRIVVDSYGAISEKNYPIAEKFERATGYSVVLENNVKALFLAHMLLSQDSTAKCQFFLRCEYGIGGALSVNGKIWNGEHERCSEIGHITAVPSGGKTCRCGRTGCLETVASPMAILEDAKQVLSNEKMQFNCQQYEDRELTLEDVLLIAENDGTICRIVNDAIDYLSVALKSIICVMDPTKIVLYGKIFDQPYFMTRLLQKLNSGYEHSVSIEKSSFNQQLENCAAGILVVDHFFEHGGIIAP